jgi:hypothetical protein
MNEITLTAYRNINQVLQISLKVLLILTIILIFVPFNVSMPGVGLDNGWQFSVNEAIAQKLVFGKDFIFTAGPFSGIYTKLYHPDTDHFTIIGGLVLAAFSSMLVFQLIKTKSATWIFLFTFFLASGNFLPDPLLFLYPLAYSFFIYQVVTGKEENLRESLKLKWFCILLTIPFGLLILIKGSLLILVSGIIVMSIGLFWRTKMRKEAIAIALTPIASVFFFQLIAHQPIGGLWHFFKNLPQVVSGYTEAMSLNGKKKEILLYLIISALILFVCFKIKFISIESKYFLILSIALFLYIAFKAGFTRHDGHAMISASALVIAGFLLYTITRHKYLNLILILSAASWVFICYNYLGTAAFSLFKPVPPIYTDSFNGLMMRFSNENLLKQQYVNRLSEIRKLHPIPILSGSADLYSFEQAILLASGNKWSPRPVMQSYSAYTPQLARINEAHLTSNKAPENILFKLETIDNRFPALDDGLSWPTIINNYTPVPKEGEFLLLKQRRSANITPRKTKILTKSCKMNQQITLPGTSDLLFAEFEINKTIFGSVLSTLFKPGSLTIHITLIDGSKTNYRIIAGMAKTGFIFSPLIENTDEFALLFSNPGQIKNKAIKSFYISNDGFGFNSKISSWNSHYTMHISKITYN